MAISGGACGDQAYGGYIPRYLPTSGRETYRRFQHQSVHVPPRVFGSSFPVGIQNEKTANHVPEVFDFGDRPIDLNMPVFNYLIPGYLICIHVPGTY